jgi:hypothetical protein
MALEVLLALLLQVGEQPADRMVECEGTRQAQAESARGYGAVKPPAPFHAVIRFNETQAEVVESTDDDVPKRFIGGRTDNGYLTFMGEDNVKWDLTLLKDTGRFEIKYFDMGSTPSRSLITRNDSITGACKVFHKNDVFN